MCWRPFPLGRSASSSRFSFSDGLLVSSLQMVMQRWPALIRVRTRACTLSADVHLVR